MCPIDYSCVINFIEVTRRLFCSTVELKTVHWAHCRWKWQQRAVFRSSAEKKKNKNTCQNIGGRQHRTTPADQILGVATPATSAALTPRWIILAIYRSSPEIKFVGLGQSLRPQMGNISQEKNISGAPTRAETMLVSALSSVSPASSYCAKVVGST